MDHKGFFYNHFHNTNTHSMSCYSFAHIFLKWKDFVDR